MKLEHRLAIPAARDRVWTLLLDVPAVAACIPGVEHVEALGDDRYRGRFRVAVGPIRLDLEGEVRFEVVSAEDGTVRLEAAGTDRRLGGGVRAAVTMTVASDGDATAMRIGSDITILGRIGEIGQPLMRRKADDVIRAFGANLAAAVADR